jgi:Family of unknown function (DUF5906)
MTQNEKSVNTPKRNPLTSNDEIKSFRLWWPLANTELLPIIPPGAPLKSDKINPALLGKIPGTRNRDGLWSGFGGKWSTEFKATKPFAAAWMHSEASVGLQARKFVGIDVDVERDATAKEITALAIEHIGDAPIRFRRGSNRVLLMYRLADGHEPMRKRRVAFMVPDFEDAQAVELLGLGQQYVVEGPHPKGGQYLWRNTHPVVRGLAKIPEITRAKANKFFTELVGLLDVYGFPIVAHGHAGVAAQRSGLDNPKHHAPTPEDVVKLLQVWRPDHMGHDEYVQALAAIKASLGPRREEFKGEVLEWSPGVRASEGDQFETRWGSINDSSLGWSWLCAQARAAGYYDDAQRDFADDLSPEQMGTALDPKSKSPLDRMLYRHVWCQQQERYVDIETGEMLTPKAFNAININVAAFGKSGTNTAEAEFQNHPLARKAVMATYRPGQPALIKDYNKRGILVPAVNQWRRSNVAPAKNVTDDDVRLWLNHVVLIFGPLNGPAARHFLDWCAFVLQRPGKKIGHALVIFGETHGTGKDTVFVPFFRAVGEHNVSTITPATLAEPWTYYLLAQLVRVEEMMNFKRGEVANKLKPMLTTPPETVTINEKNVKQYDIPNIQNWVMFTNHENAIPIEDSDRRYWVHRCLLDAPREPAYYAALYDWYDKGGTEKVAGWLLQRDISAFNPMAPPPDTDAKREMREQSQPAAVRWLRGLFGPGRHFAGRTVMVVQELRDAADEQFGAPEVNHKHAAAVLKLSGFKKTHHVKIDGDATNIWTRGSSGELSVQQVRERYFAETARVARVQAA